MRKVPTAAMACTAPEVPVAASLAEALAQPGAGRLLGSALGARFGWTGRSRVDLTAATGLGVSPRTVRRWLHDEPDRPTVPARRRPQILAAVRPSERTRTRELLSLQHADQGLRRIRLGRRRGNLAQYDTTGWLHPHTVVVLELPERGLCRVAVTRDSPPTADRIRRGTEVLDHVTVSNRFAAVVVRFALLAEVDPWRVEAGPDFLSKGHTQLWLAAAPLPALMNFARGRRFRSHPSTVRW